MSEHQLPAHTRPRPGMHEPEVVEGRRTVGKQGIAIRVRESLHQHFDSQAVIGFKAQRKLESGVSCDLDRRVDDSLAGA